MTEPRKLMSSVSQALAGAQMSPRRKFNTDCLWLICSKAGLVLRRAGCCCVPQAGSSVSFSGGACVHIFLCSNPFLWEEFWQAGSCREFPEVSKCWKGRHRVAQNKGKQPLSSSVEMSGCSAPRVGLTRALEQLRFGIVRISLWEALKVWAQGT